MFYYNQHDYSNVPYDRKSTAKVENISTSGCGVCSSAMAINNLAGKEIFTIKSLAEFSIKNGARDEGGTVMVTLLNAICKKYKDFSYKKTEKGADLVKHLANGGVAIVHQGNKNYPLLSTGGHYCYAYKVDGDNVYIADPAYTSTRYTTDFRKSHIVKATKNGCVVNIANLNKATTAPSYYLISYTKPKAEPSKEEPKKAETKKAEPKKAIKAKTTARLNAYNSTKYGTPSQVLPLGAGVEIIEKSVGVMKKNGHTYTMSKISYKGKTLYVANFFLK